jgi:hypothetical protein
VIVGAHWQSDVDASRVAASSAYGALHGSPEFLEQMKKAQAEYRQLTGQETSINNVIAPAPATSNQAYRIDGIMATEDTRGIIIRNGKKVLRP